MSNENYVRHDENNIPVANQPGSTPDTSDPGDGCGSNTCECRESNTMDNAQPVADNSTKEVDFIEYSASTLPRILECSTLCNYQRLFKYFCVLLGTSLY